MRLQERNSELHPQRAGRTAKRITGCSEIRVSVLADLLDFVIKLFLFLEQTSGSRQNRTIKSRLLRPVKRNRAGLSGLQSNRTHPKATVCGFGKATVARLAAEQDSIH